MRFHNQNLVYVNEIQKIFLCSTLTISLNKINIFTSFPFFKKFQILVIATVLVKILNKFWKFAPYIYTNGSPKSPKRV